MPPHGKEMRTTWPLPASKASVQIRASIWIMLVTQWRLIKLSRTGSSVEPSPDGDLCPWERTFSFLRKRLNLGQCTTSFKPRCVLLACHPLAEIHLLSGTRDLMNNGRDPVHRDFSISPIHGGKSGKLFIRIQNFSQLQSPFFPFLKNFFKIKIFFNF